MLTKEGGTKVLSIGGDTSAPKPKAKVLSIGGTAAPPKEKTDSKPDAKAEASTKPEAGQKATAAKAIEKTGEKAGKAAATAKTSGKTSPTPSSGRSSPSGPGDKKAQRDVDAVTKEQAADVDGEAELGERPDEPGLVEHAPLGPLLVEPHPRRQGAFEDEHVAPLDLLVDPPGEPPGQQDPE